jgi:hypothetical protein
MRGETNRDSVFSIIVRIWMFRVVDIQYYLSLRINPFHTLGSEPQL